MNSKNRVNIFIGITTHNNVDNLDSIIKIAHSGFDYLIVDNHSTDGLLEQLQLYNINYVLAENKDGGLGQFRNMIIDHASEMSHDFIIFFDGNDEIDLNSISQMATEIDDSDDFVFTRVLTKDKDLKIVPMDSIIDFSGCFTKEQLVQQPNHMGIFDSNGGIIYNLNFIKRYHLNYIDKEPNQDRNFNTRYFNHAKNYRVFQDKYFYIRNIQDNSMKKILFIFGTRPEFIKIYPIIMQAKKVGNKVVVVNTGQHKEMVNELLDYFNLEVDYDLQIMNKCNGLMDILTHSLSGLDDIIKEVKPDLVLVHGDTSATLAGSLSAFYNQVKLGHIEAGLRTYNKYSPFPEEVNRQLTGIIADYHFVPTETARQNLLSEGKDEKNLFVVGNSAIDMLKYTIQENYTHEILEWQSDKKLILMTAHRRENIDELDEIFKAINIISDKYQDNYKIVYPIHMNPTIREKAKKHFTSKNIKIVNPLDTFNFHNIMKHSHLILTDSGGIQEEAPSFGVPVIVLRDTTERPEGVEAGTLKLVGTNCQDIIDSVDELLQDEELYRMMSTSKNPYGNGDTAAQILDILNVN